MKAWFSRLAGTDRSVSRLKTLMADYPPYRIPFPGSGHALTHVQAEANLDFLLTHRRERLEIVGALLQDFSIDLEQGLAAVDPKPFLDALRQWTATAWPALHDPALDRWDRWVASERDGPEIVVSLVQDIAIALGEMVLVRRDDYGWTLDVDPDNQGATPDDGMRSWQRPVLLRPGSGVVPVLQFDYEDIVHGVYAWCSKPGYAFDQSIVECVTTVLSS